MSKPIKHNIQGILLLDKSIGLSSNAALQKVKYLFAAKKAGHTGSLDPLATGMLPLCFGEATKFSQFLLNSDKEYQVTLKLGEKTTTGDAEGEVISTRTVDPLTYEAFAAVLEEFTGPINQIPPMFSALKHHGKPLYQLAREGIEVERKPRTIQIFGYKNLQVMPTTVTFEVQCSKGTYIRTLVEDIGERIGCGAHVIQLRRISVTPYYTAKMYLYEELVHIHQEHGIAGLQRLLLPMETSVHALPAVELSSSAAFYINTGQAVTINDPTLVGLVRIFSNQKFLGIGEMLADGRLTPKRLMSA